MNPLCLSSGICCLKGGILKLYKGPWIYVYKSPFLGWSWHLFFGHPATLSQGDVQVWDLSKWENSSQARLAVEIHERTGCGYLADSRYGIFRNLCELSACESLFAVGYCPEVWIPWSCRDFIQHAVHWPCDVCVCPMNTERVSWVEQSGVGVSRGWASLLCLCQICLTGIAVASKNTP